MSEDDTSSAEKEHDPTPKKLEDARNRGEIVRSADLTAAAGYAGFLIAAVMLGPHSFRELGTMAMILLAQADTMAPLVLAGETGPLGGLLWAITRHAAPWFAIPAAAALLCVIAQRALVFTGENLEPKLSRISPLANAAHKFGAAGLFEFAKSAVKLVLISVVLGLFLIARLPDILGSVNLSPGMMMVQLMGLTVEFLFIVLGISVVLGAVDYLWQRHLHLQRNRMSRQDMIDEMKQNEGDPHTKQQRRQRGYDIAMNQMLTEVPKADVVIVNPEHYAVALKWNRGGRGAPVCIAKGVDEIAARIRAAAAEAGVPVHRDPPTARALFATVELGQEIPPEHYRAVAAAIRFAEKMRIRARARRMS